MLKVLFVDDEPMVLSGLRRTLRSLRDHWSMQFASSAAEARDILRVHPVDAVVSDLRMPVEDGSQLMSFVAMACPSAARFVLTGYADRDCVLRTVPTTHQLIAKPCPPEQLINRLNAIAGIFDPGRKELERQIVTKTNWLPACPQNLQALGALTELDTTCNDDIARLVMRDAGLSIQVLRLAAGAYFAAPSSNLDVGEAVSRLGAGLIQQLVHDFEIVKPVNWGGDIHAKIEVINDSLNGAETAERLAALAPLLAIRHADDSDLQRHDWHKLTCQLLALWGFEADMIELVQDRLFKDGWFGPPSGTSGAPLPPHGQPEIMPDNRIGA